MKRKVTFSLEADVINTLKMMSTLTSQEQSALVSAALTLYFSKLGESSGKSAAEFMEFMKEAKTIANSMRAEETGSYHSLLPVGVEEETHSTLPGDSSSEESSIEEVLGEDEKAS